MMIIKKNSRLQKLKKNKKSFKLIFDFFKYVGCVKEVSHYFSYNYFITM